MTRALRPALLFAVSFIVLGGCATSGGKPDTGATMAPAAFAASPDNIDKSQTTQLPRDAVPRNYAIEVAPHADTLTFDGKVRITLDVTEPTDTLTFNAADLAIARATITAADGTSQKGRISLNSDAQTANARFDTPLAPGLYALDMVYSGKINTQANGLFALDYKDAKGAAKRSLFTQFEAPDARRFVPSWDEPDYKASFDLTAIVPAGEMAVSNMPVKSSKPLADGLKRVTFETTPVMSSYLLFFGKGDFGRISKMVGDTEVGIVMSKGNEEKARTALNDEAQILPYYNEYFGIPYPLPKLDNVAGPGQSQFFGAMENWGAIFTFERILLDDPAITTESERHAIFSVQAHEMAHQWFGDLVTMAWWDDLWLNEGFASWMENKTTQHFHPDWGADIDAVSSREAAMGQDAYATTHPIVQKIQTVEQTNQAFDAITYSKGESVISMLEGYAGPDVWRRGIQSYIRTHQYQNTTTDDLWRAVEGAGANGLTTIAHDFTLQPGIPLITVGKAQCVDGNTRVTVTQGQFSRDRRDAVAAKPLSWHVPLSISAGAAKTTVVTAGPTTDMTVAGCGPLLVNAGQTGYYRTLYTADQLARLKSAFGSLGAVDQYGLLNDSLALSYAGYQPIAPSLDLIAAVPASANRKVLTEGIGTLAGLYAMFDGDVATQTRLAAMIETRYAPVLGQIGLVPRTGEPVLDTTLRPTLIGALGAVGDSRVRAEGDRLFAAMQRDRDAMPGSLKSTWLGIVAYNATAAQWDQLHSMAKGATGAVERSTLYALLGAAKDQALAQRALDLALTDEPGPTVSAGMLNAVAARNPELALDFVLAHLDRVNALVDSSAASRFVARLASGSDQEATIGKLDAYAKANLPESARTPIKMAINSIRTRLADRPRIKREVRAWVARH